MTATEITLAKPTMKKIAMKMLSSSWLSNDSSIEDGDATLAIAGAAFSSALTCASRAPSVSR